MRPITYHRRARNDLDQIWLRVAVHDVAAADKLIGDIRDATARLSTFPLSAPARSNFGPGIRGISVRKHLVFYIVRQRSVLILRIFDGRRNIVSLSDD